MFQKDLGSERIDSPVDPAALFFMLHGILFFYYAKTLFGVNDSPVTGRICGFENKKGAVLVSLKMLRMKHGKRFLTQKRNITRNYQYVLVLPNPFSGRSHSMTGPQLLLLDYDL